MQFNPGQKTIEGEVMDAMTKAGAVSEANAGQFGKVSRLLHSYAAQCCPVESLSSSARCDSALAEALDKANEASMQVCLTGDHPVVWMGLHARCRAQIM